VFVIVDDISKYTWTLFLGSKDETFDVFCVFVRMIQQNLGYNVLSIRTDHGIEFENSKFLKLCGSHGIDHNFSAP